MKVLITRLLNQSVRGLQSADTEYLTKSDGSYETLPDGKPWPVLYQELFTSARHKPSELVAEPYPVMVSPPRAGLGR
jgi:hypothetical protein